MKDLVLTNKVSKEDFKRYFVKCPKEAWIFYSLQNFKTALKLKTNVNLRAVWKDALIKKKIKHHNDTVRLTTRRTWQNNLQIKHHFQRIETHLKVVFDSAEDFDTSTGFDPFAIYERLLTAADLTPEEQMQKEVLQTQFANIDGLDMHNVDAETIVDGNLVGSEARAYLRSQLKLENNLNKTDFGWFSFESLPYYEALEKTQKILEQKKYKLLFEPTFEYQAGKMRVKCDALINYGNKQVEIIEVKASSHHKPEHFYDLMYQWYVLTKLGYNVIKTSLCLINPDYYRGMGILDADDINFNSDFEEIDFQTEIYEPFLEKEFASTSKPGIPDDIAINSLFYVSECYMGSKTKHINFVEMFKNINKTINLDLIINKMQLELNNIETLLQPICPKYKFDYKNENLKFDQVVCQTVVRHYEKTRPNLFQLTRFKKDAAEIYYNTGLVYLTDVYEKIDFDDFYKPNGKLYFNENSQRIVKVTVNYEQNNHQKNPTDIVKMSKMKDILELLKDYYKFPVYMYDFETAKWAIPNFNRSKTYQQIPFQYSIHVLTDENYDFNHPNETMKHFNFIANELIDPRVDFIQNFIKDSFSCGPGVYVAYNVAFEKMVLKQLMWQFPEYYKPLKWIYQNTIDLMSFFNLKENNWLIYDPEFCGSYSIKKTQPALDSTLSYQDLKINKGDKASATFRQFMDKVIAPEIWTNIIREDMLKYCDRDTLAMVVVLQSVVKLIKEVKPDFKETVERLNGEEECIK
ncbi:hypothetical protein SCLAR_v1c09950 [Spiroplasma clarkii]|uniref:DUF2779 domain-containing protein n=3 Tax=Spiroplasma clarkii TaxID=2139 RepID=A0A2K8KHZ8_9MOLU|nr:hypothetical protein SCLAR_v1c09950 [Spiroplasma clarkii]